MKRKHGHRLRAQDGSLEIALNPGSQTNSNALTLWIASLLHLSYSDFVDILDVFRVVLHVFLWYSLYGRDIPSTDVLL